MVVGPDKKDNLEIGGKNMWSNRILLLGLLIIGLGISLSYAKPNWQAEFRKKVVDSVWSTLHQDMAFENNVLEKSFNPMERKDFQDMKN